MDIPADDRGFTLGVGLFETILVEDGAPAFWQAHLERLARGCKQLGLPAPAAAACAEAAAAALAAEDLRQGRAALRLTWTGGSGPRGLSAPASPRPRLIATASRAAPPPPSMSLATVAIRRNATSLTSRLKTLSYLDNVLAREAALAAGADEALMLNTEGFVTGGAAANLFWYRGDVLCTPSLACGVLDGIMRAEVLRAARAQSVAVQQIAAEPHALRSSDGVFLTSSLIGVIAVSSLDGHELPCSRRLAVVLPSK